MLLTEMLEQLRSAVGVPLIVTSGYRCPRHNARVDGSARSLHMSGRAADIRGGISFQRAAEQYARSIGFDEIIPGGARGYIHLAVKIKKGDQR